MLRALCLLVFLGSVFGKHEDWRVVELEGLGEVKGVKYWDGEFHEFYGVPYATAPTGRDRYKAPLPPTPWEDRLKANRQLTMCRQVYYRGEVKQEEDDFLAGEDDCLVAHLMVPKIGSEKNLLPVMVYIHSGAFVGGSGSMVKMHKLGHQDIVVVALNYRLGALGFACLGTEDVPGNAALKDIIAGLKWINKHIKSFGGDPNRVTLAGFSVGATLAELVALTKESEGLFQRLMLDSGSALSPFAVDRDPINTARNIAKSIGFEDSGTIHDLNEFLLEAPLEELLANSRQFFLMNSTFGFAPCIENPEMPGALLTESPYDILKKGNYGNFDVFTGFANLEGISRTSQFKSWSELMDEDLTDFLPADLAFANKKERNAFIKELRQKYFNGKDVSLHGFIDYFSDSMFKYGIMKSAKFHAQRNPIYLYEFNYVGKLNTKHHYHDKVFGASHRDASAYVLDFYDWTRNFTDMDMREKMVTMWTDFVKYNNPTAYETTLYTVKWQKYTNKDQKYLDIGYDLVMKTGLFEDSYKLWDKAYQKAYWNPTAPNPAEYKPTVAKSDKPKAVPVKVEDEKATSKPETNEEKTATSKVTEEKVAAKTKTTKKIIEPSKTAPKTQNTEEKLVPPKETDKVATETKPTEKIEATSKTAPKSESTEETVDSLKATAEKVAPKTADKVQNVKKTEQTDDKPAPKVEKPKMNNDAKKGERVNEKSK